MLSVCSKCRNNTESKNQKIARSKMEESNSKQQEASGLLSSLKIKTPLSKIPLVGPLLF